MCDVLINITKTQIEQIRDRLRKSHQNPTMEPSGKPQPPENAAYETEGNAATSNPAEERAAHHRGHGQPVARRDPGNQSLGIGDAVPSSLGRGARGEEEHSRPTQSETGLGNEIEGDTMRAPAEGRVADAVDRKPGASGSQPDLASDLDR